MAKNKFEYVTKSSCSLTRKRKTQVVEDALAAIIAREGVLNPQQVVEESRSATHPLHEYFEWDDSAAAEKYRQVQARAMILATRYVCFLANRRRVESKVVEEAGDAVQVRRFLPAYTVGGFKERPDVLSDEQARKSIVDRKMSALRSWCSSVVDIAELAAIRTAVLNLLG